MTLMHAEILWLDPADMERGSAILTEQGFQIEVLDLVDPYGPTVWIIARIAVSDFNDLSSCIGSRVSSNRPVATLWKPVTPIRRLGPQGIEL